MQSQIYKNETYRNIKKNKNMKKILFILCFIQCFMLKAQTQTVVSPYGKKITFNPVFPYIGENGLTLTDHNLQLGGSLLKATTLTASSSNTLLLKGLQTGNSFTDQVVVTDPATGALKKVAPTVVTGLEPWYNIADNTPATANTQDIYQMGNVGIGQNAANTKLDLKNATAGALQIQDGTQKAGFVLKSDADGVGTWQVNDLSTNVVKGTITNVPINFTGSGYAGCSITLSTGNWAIYAGLLINNKTGVVTTPINNTFDARFIFYSSSTATSTTGYTFIDSNQIIFNFGDSGINPNPSSIMFLNGGIRVNVTAASLTLYLWDFGSSSNLSIKNDPENFLYAIQVQ